MGTINERILAIVNEMFKGNASAFCRAIDVPQPTIKDIISGRLNKPSYSVLEKILGDNGLNISAEWLMRGIGDMSSNNQVIEKVYHSPMTGVNVKGNGININSGNVDTLLSIVKKSQEQVDRFQQQVDRLLGIIEKQYR